MEFTPTCMPRFLVNHTLYLQFPCCLLSYSGGVLGDQSLGVITGYQAQMGQLLWLMCA